MILSRLIPGLPLIISINFQDSQHFVIFVYTTCLRRFFYIVFIFLAVLTGSCFAQDIHFSQFNASLLNLSPGYTGLFNGDYRVGAVYRSQWHSVPVSYSTFGVSGERRIQPRMLRKDMIGLGLMVNNDRAGDARYGTTQVYASGSYIYLARPDSSLIITLGGNVGWCRFGFDYSRMTFDNQFDGFGYNRTLGSGEQFSWTSVNFIDMSLGSVIQYIHKGRHRFSYGLGLQHLSTPVITYQDNDLSKLSFKWTNCLSYTTPLRDRTDIIAEMLFVKQGNNYELIPHASLKYHFDRAENKAVLGGLCLRAGDALMMRLGYTYNTLQCGASYDINISRFNQATNLRGGFELFVNYIIRLSPGFVAKKRYCPVFM
jgi:type IX secretion system PorP/SprF family membrane protein